MDSEFAVEPYLQHDLDEEELERLAVDEALEQYAIEEELCAVHVGLTALKRDPRNRRLRQLTVTSLRELSDMVAAPLAQEASDPPRKPR